MIRKADSAAFSCSLIIDALSQPLRVETIEAFVSKREKPSGTCIFEYITYITKGTETMYVLQKHDK